MTGDGSPQGCAYGGTCTSPQEMAGRALKQTGSRSIEAALDYISKMGYLDPRNEQIVRVIKQTSPGKKQDRGWGELGWGGWPQSAHCPVPRGGHEPALLGHSARGVGGSRWDLPGCPSSEMACTLPIWECGRACFVSLKNENALGVKIRQPSRVRMKTLLTFSWACGGVFEKEGLFHGF